MRNLLLLGGVALALAAFGCSSNPVAGANDASSGAVSSDALIYGSQVPTPQPTVQPGFFGTVSNLDLSAGTFTLTSPDGRTLNVATTPGTQVLFQGEFTNVGTSALKNGQKVTVSGSVAGLPQHATARAALIIINSRPANLL